MNIKESPTGKQCTSLKNMTPDAIIIRERSRPHSSQGFYKRKVKIFE